MRDRIRSAIAAGTVLAAMCLSGAAQDRKLANNESDRILSLENAWNQAEVKHDARALNMLLAETFEYTDDDGSFMDRSQWLAHVGGRADRYEQLSNRGMTVHLYGNVAIVNGQYFEKLKVKGKLIARSDRFTDTWIQQNGEWRCVASQSTLISP